MRKGLFVIRGSFLMQQAGKRGLWFSLSGNGHTTPPKVADYTS
ncbi:uncharacterized protein G2W53_037045 [Senna tora]|uniref:Uncharacterized protein n=1 Tax=Senna tora TaxID=362788 RepID=A0A834SYI5_9FABA|nr:uncharacterized protein G2W53_037045 [Senna tora]